MKKILEFFQKHKKVIIVIFVIIAAILICGIIGKLASWALGSGGVLATWMSRRKSKEDYERTQKELDKEIEENEIEIKKKIEQFEWQKEKNNSARENISRVRERIGAMSDKEKDEYVKGLFN